MKYIIILIYLLSFHCYSDESKFSNNCVYDDIKDNGFIPVHNIRFKASDIDLGVDIGQPIAEMSFTDAALSTSILHCKKEVDLKLITQGIIKMIFSKQIFQELALRYHLIKHLLT